MFPRAVMPAIKIVPRRSGERAHRDLGWLRTSQTFETLQDVEGGHYGFGNLRILNEDRVQAHTGFGMHSHSEFEIFSYVISGELAHHDSMGNIEVLKRGDIQMTSAGTGIRHSEKAHGEEQVHFLQIWAFPEHENLQPQYYTRHFTDDEKRDRWVRIVAPVGTEGVIDKREAIGPTPIHSSVSVYVTVLSRGASISYTVSPSHGNPRKIYVHFIESPGYDPDKAAFGQIGIAGSEGAETELREGDGAYIVAEGGAYITVSNTGPEHAEVVLFEVE
ncbi:hypothetical protein EIP91_008971 [Steccherinum ochraceum]|uniref:Pirin N-terminal domain-containing protein n=1 Tax=Steccherinum ochraceum TaxID=92696 RepID=A0A4R0RPJ4_9APHY|nr:hypothetical protein EIP91_008971 [Steccherinum ochraceum]